MTNHLNDTEPPLAKPTVPAVYSHKAIREAGYDPEQLLPRLTEVMAMFELLVKLAPPKPDAVHFHAWARSAKLIEEVSL